MIGQTSSRSAWLNLNTLFTSKSQVRLLHLQYQFATLRKNTDSIPIYSNKVKLLAAAGKSLSDTEFTTYLLAGLESNLDSLVTSITTRVDFVSPDAPFSHLLMHEACLSHHTTTDISTNVSTKQSLPPLLPQPNIGHRFQGQHGRGYRGYRCRARGGCPPSPFPDNLISLFRLHIHHLFLQITLPF